MTATAYRTLAVWAVVSVILILTACSQTGTAPKVGTPAFYWSAAKETYAAGDYVKTIEHLDKLVASENEYAAKAQPWLLVLASGMSRGYMDLASSFEAGSRANRANPTAFRKQMIASRAAASRHALHFAEVFGKFQNNKDEYVSLAFAYPPGLPTPVVALSKVAGGTMLSPTDLESAQKRALERGLLLSTCGAAGAPDDPAKAQDLMKGGEGKVARATFMMAMARALHEQADLYSRTKLDEPEKARVLCTRAQEALKTIPETKQTKELNSKIQKTLKGLKAS